MKQTFLFVILVLLLSNCTPGFESGINYSRDLSNIQNSSNANGETDEIIENDFIATKDEEISTFSVDADGGSYSNIRKYIESNSLPPKTEIRTEEIINYFSYDYPFPTYDPIALNGDISSCPWNKNHKLLRIGIQGKKLERKDMPAANFVFLIDESGSMNSEDKLELLKQGFIIYADYMRPIDKIAIVTYAGNARVVLESTTGDKKEKIKAAINNLKAGGSTNGEGGILKAYEIAQSNSINNGNNRIILGTDGDFNVGISSQDELIKLIEEKRKTGVFLSVLGVGTNGYQDSKMEQLANHGNGIYEFIDNLDQAKKIFVEEFGKFYTVAKDVKVQVSFNPDQIEKYRLIGYENRVLNNNEFENDTIDAGEIGSNQSITALYELIPTNSSISNQYPIHVDFRYKNPDQDFSKLLTLDIGDQNITFDLAPENTRFASTAAAYGMMLLNSKYKGDINWTLIKKWAQNSQKYDPSSHRKEFFKLIEKAEKLK